MSNQSHHSSITEINKFLVTYNENLELHQFYTNPSNTVIAYTIKIDRNKSTLIFRGSTHLGDTLVPYTKDLKTDLYTFGTTIDIFNRNIFTGEQHSGTLGDNQIFKVAPNVSKRKPLDTPLLTGIHAIDIFNPIGLGQRTAIIGDHKTGKTQIALNTIINQNSVKTIYVLVGKSLAEVTNIDSFLKKHNKRDDTLIIHSDPENTFDIFFVPYIALYHAENLAKEGHDVLVILDDLVKHAWTLREIGLINRQPVMTEAYPADLFYAHSKLLERGGSFVSEGEQKVGTITILPILTSIQGDLKNPVISNDMSITDGQIITDSTLAAKNIYPAIDLGLSVSRTGGDVQIREIRAVAKELNQIYQNYQQTKIYEKVQSLNKEVSISNEKGANLTNFLVQPGASKFDLNVIKNATYMILWNVWNKKEIDSIKMSKFVNWVLKYDEIGKQVYRKLNANQAINHERFGDYLLNILNYCGYNFETKYDFGKPLDAVIEHCRQIVGI